MEQEHEKTADELIKKNQQNNDGNRPKANKTNAQLGCLGIVVVLAIAGIFMWKMCSSEEPSSKTPQVTIGSNVIIQRPRGGEIYLGVTKESQKQMLKYVRAGDQVGLANMIFIGSVITVDSGTKALVIDISLDEFEVRIQSGSYNNDSGWVSSGFVKLAE